MMETYKLVMVAHQHAKIESGYECFGANGTESVCHALVCGNALL